MKLVIIEKEKYYFVNKKEGEKKMIHFENIEQLFGKILASKRELTR